MKGHRPQRGLRQGTKYSGLSDSKDVLKVGETHRDGHRTGVLLSVFFKLDMMKVHRSWGKLLERRKQVRSLGSLSKQQRRQTQNTPKCLMYPSSLTRNPKLKMFLVFVSRVNTVTFIINVTIAIYCMERCPKVIYRT